MTYYADYLFRAGATVVPMRPVGRQINEVVVDNDSAGVTFTGAWTNSTTALDYYDEDYGAAADACSLSLRQRERRRGNGNRHLHAQHSGGRACIRSTPGCPAARIARRRLYEINHTGGANAGTRRPPHGRLRLGVPRHVSLQRAAARRRSARCKSAINSTGGGRSSSPTPSASATAWATCRMATAGSARAISGYPREDENSEHWICRSLGVGHGASPSTVFSGNVSAPSNMAEWMNQNANPFGTTRVRRLPLQRHDRRPRHGDGPRGSRPDRRRAAPRHISPTSRCTWAGRSTRTCRLSTASFEHNWSTRTTHTFTGGFGEIDLGAAAEMDATIIEVAFHDNVQDAALLRDPKVRDQLARSIYQGTLEYFDNWGGLTSPTSVPTRADERARRQQRQRRRSR